MSLDESWIVEGPAGATRTFVFAHGAGAAMDTPFMDHIAAGLAERGIRVVRFEFPYMAQRRTTGRKRGPDRKAVLEQTWRDVVSQLGSPGQLVLGGKSMGGRYASMLADELHVAGVACLGYPFHAPGRDALRIEHLLTMSTPCLIVQGSRDSMGTDEQVAGYGLPSGIELQWMPDGDHSLKPRVKSGHTQAEHLNTAVETVAAFIDRVIA